MLTIISIAAVSAAQMDALDAGDRAWFSGDREAASDFWTEAAQVPSPAIQAMAALRLLQVSGNLGMARHGPRADDALARCPTSDTLCSLARADYEIFLALYGLPHDLADARMWVERAAADHPGRAQARRVLLGDAASQTLAAYPDRGGLGDGLLAEGGWPRGPGTWYLGVGVSGAPGLGLGLATRFVHPDLGWAAWRLELNAAGTSRGILSLHTSIVSPGRRFIMAQAVPQRRVLDDFASQTTQTVWTADATAAVGLRARTHTIWAGPLLRWDDDVLYGGGQGGWTTQRGVWDAQVSGEVTRPGQHHRLDGVLTACWPLGAGQLATRLAAEEAIGSAAPWWRQPVAGAGRHLRSAPANRWRAPWLAATALEWRQPLYGPLGMVLFAEAAWIDGLHPGVGTGIRLYLPPQPTNTVRLDIAYGQEGFSLTAGWNEAF